MSLLFLNACTLIPHSSLHFTFLHYYYYYIVQSVHSRCSSSPRQIVPDRVCSASASCFALAAPQSFLSLLHPFSIASSSSSSFLFSFLLSYFSIQRSRFSFCPGVSPLSGSHPILSHFIAFPVRIRESTLHTKFDLQLQVIDSSSVAFRCPLFLPSTLLQVLNTNLSCCLLASIILSGVSCVHIPLSPFTLLSPLYTTTAL